MTTPKFYTNKIEAKNGKQIKVDENLLPAGVTVNVAEVTFWPDYKPRGRAAKNAA